MIMLGFAERAQASKQSKAKQEDGD